jgi:Tfp pilus assembly protein PilX
MMNKRMRHSILTGTDGRQRRAAILVLTLWIVVVLGLISASMLEEIYLELKLAKFQRDDFEAMALARAGLARAVADLRNDLILDRSTQSEMLDTLSDVWARTDEDGPGHISGLGG